MEAPAPYLIECNTKVRAVCPSPAYRMAQLSTGAFIAADSHAASNSADMRGNVLIVPPKELNRQRSDGVGADPAVAGGTPSSAEGSAAAVVVVIVVVVVVPVLVVTVVVVVVADIRTAEKQWGFGGRGWRVQRSLAKLVAKTKAGGR